jgi:hypothetical protein
VAAGVFPAELVVRTSPDHIGAEIDRVLHQFLHARGLQPALLRERDDLQVKKVAIFFLELERGLGSDQPLNRIDVGMRANRHRAVPDRHVEDLPGAIENIFPFLPRLQNARHANCFIERSRAGRQPAMQEGLVEVQMWFDEARKRDAPFSVDLLIDLLLDLLLNDDNPAIGNSNVHERLFVADPYPTNDHVHF